MTSDSSVQGGPVRRSPGPRPFHRWWVLVGVGALVAAACGSSSTGSSSSSSSNVTSLNPTTWNESTVSWLKANVNDTGTAPSTPTGDLTLAGTIDVSGMLDPQGEYDTNGYRVLEALDRSLMFYPPSSDFNTATSLVPDGASAYTISSDGLTYTFKVRSGMRWAVTNPSTGAPVSGDGTPVTSQDYELGLERECDPADAPLGNPSYYTATITGYSSFCTGYEALAATSTAAQRAAYIAANPISGISTPDSSTLVITLMQPASDFLNIMAMFFAAAAPQIALNYVPQTAGNPIWSDGPYEVANYTPGTDIKLVPNPYWGATTGTNLTATTWSEDPVADRYSADIDINETLGSSAGE